MKIAFLNPWREAAENQAFSSLRIAAERVGHELVHCSNSTEVEECAPEFVLAAASTQPKLNAVPHYGVIHEPRNRFLTNRRYFYNLLSYDGYLTISETLERFVRDVTFGTGQPKPTGFYYNTCQRQQISSDLPGLINRRELRITYFGTNWDKRRHPFFRLLSESEGVEICGPEHSWRHICRQGYGGTLPFDGMSVQAKYSANGIGLCMLSDLHLSDDVVSNRLFEITSVGAIALCCDIPWIRRHFGDSVYYFDQRLTDRALERAILRLRDLIYQNPEAAIARARKARQIFEEKFAAEVMIKNAVEYHQDRCSDRQAARTTAEASYSPLISVIVRCGSRPLRYLERAVRSISQQTYGRFEVILVKHKEIDLTPFKTCDFPRIECFQTIACIGGNRSTSLWAGLNAVRGQYFCILDDDDWWFSNHFEQLFQPPPKEPLTRFMAYSGTITLHRQPVAIDGGGYDCRELHRFGIESQQPWHAATSAFASHCFVASSDLLHPRLLVCPGMETAEDSYLILSLLAQVQPRFSYAATCVYDRTLTDQSGFANHPERRDDELAIYLRLLLRDRPDFLPADTWKSISEHWSQRQALESTEAEPDSQEESPETILRDWEQLSAGYDSKASTFSAKSRPVDENTGCAIVQTPAEPWSYGAALFVRRPEREPWEYALAVELRVRSGTVGVGLLNAAEDDFLFRQRVTMNPELQTVHFTIRDVPQIGRLVVQNWETPGRSVVELISIRVMAEPL
ncbi:MAG TPA: glycosyltransferase family A protein [Bryobacteraceae bacterium]|nr:glycosyltransferase family A protein [Bryobacteraceae bacterium]